MGITYTLNVGVGLVALQMVNVPMFFCLRRLVAPMILIYEYIMLSKIAPIGVRGSVGVIVLGTLLAGWDTLNDDILGYSLTLANNVLTAAASVLQKQLCDKLKLSTVGVVYANAIIAAPLSAFFIIATGEIDKIIAFPYNGSAIFWTGFFLASVMGFFLTFTSILSTTYNSPLATSVTGNAKDIATTAIGWV
jgi:drug/metabolite transporter (DMT)-like permease